MEYSNNNCMNLSQINELTISAYNKTAIKYHELFKDEMNNKRYDQAILDEFSEMIHKKGLICDAGCGPSGQIGKYLQDKGHEIIGIDISPKCVKIARNHHPEIEFKEMDMMHTEFRNDEFDGITSFYSILFTPKNEVDKIIREFNRILKIEGKLLIVVKKGKDEGLMYDDWYEGNQIYFTKFIESEMEEYLSRNGFRVEFIDTRNPYEDEIKEDRIYIIGSKEKSYV
jgi:ubiquinone/menaquinone biosynthesis C-methylase UbiE